MEDQVVHAEVPVDDRGLVSRGNVLRQPFDQPVHRLDALGLRAAVLLAPAPDLARKVVPRLAEIGEPHSGEVDAMQGGDDAVHLVVDRAARSRAHAGERLFPQHAALDIVHDVERTADHALVLAQEMRARHRKPRPGERREHAELPFHRVC
jgi:hypothetical protein